MHDTYIWLDGEAITLAEAHQRYGSGAFPKPIIGNCFRMSEYMSLPIFSPVGWLSNGILPLRSKMLLFGEPKSGKSFLAMQLAHSVAESLPWLGYQPHPDPNINPITAYFQSEISEGELKCRMAPLSPSPTMFIETVHGMSLLGSDTDKLWERLTILQPSVLVLDPLYMLMEGDLTNISHITTVNKTIDLIIDQFGCSVVIVHHSRKLTEEQSKDSLLNALGSVAIPAFYDSILWLEKRDGFMLLHFALRHDKSPSPLPIMQTDNGLFGTLDVLSVLTDDWKDVEDIRMELGLQESQKSRTVLSEVLVHLSTTGAIEKTTTRKYRRAQ